jgi:hypothetical protein
MNIFFLDRDPEEAARAMIDKHIVKMPTESAQLLSCAHRFLDGEYLLYEFWDEQDRDRKKKMWVLPDEDIKMGWILDNERGPRLRPHYTHPRGFTLYAATHLNHPCCTWSMQGELQYEWHFQLLRAMLREYTKRYEKIHGVEKLLPLLEQLPKNLPRGTPWTDPPLAMPNAYKQSDHVAAYRYLYNRDKARFAKWTKTDPPDWFHPQF